MKLVIAGGGTGGHLFPGIAVAEAVRGQGDGATVLFVGTENGIEKTAVPKAGFDIRFIEVKGLKRVSILQKVATLTMLPRAVAASMTILRSFQATAVLGVGGYASGPVLVAAKLLGIPAAICEQNSVTGLTNRWLGKVVRRVFLTFEAARPFFPAAAAVRVGNPVRRAFVEAAATPPPAPDDKLVFVFGGSQGARPLNEAMPDALSAVRALGHDIHVLHQAGRSEVQAVQARYDAVGLRAEVVPFIDDMVQAYRRAALVICRAGATSCAEITALGVPAILVPFPQAADDHQRKNAEDLKRVDACEIVEQAVLREQLASQVASLLSDDNKRQALAKNAGRAGRLDAAAVVANSARHGFVDAISEDAP